jgi:hypothetical protein
MKWALFLLGCYRKSDCDDPEIFVSAAVSIMSRYPEEAVRRVTSLNTGLPATSKWVPTISELREALENANRAAERIREQEARIAAQFAERDRMADMSPAEKRKEFIKREMAKINAVLAANPDKPPPPIDIRGMEECAEKDALRRRLEADIARQVERNRSTPIAPLDAWRTPHAAAKPGDAA